MLYMAFGARTINKQTQNSTIHIPRIAGRANFDDARCEFAVNKMKCDRMPRYEATRYIAFCYVNTIRVYVQ